MADYFSGLPESLIHHILSFLPFKEIGRTCVLSKYFNSIWCNYPNLDFSFHNNPNLDLPFENNPNLGFPFMNNEEYMNLLSALVEKSEQAFSDHVENSLGQCVVRRPFIQELRLQISSFTELNNFTPKLDRWLGLSVDKNVSRLVLITDIMSPRKIVHYSVPQQVFVARTLKVLDLTWCTLEEDRIVHIELPCLEKLSLSRCRILGDNLLQKIVCASPKNKHILISWCTRRPGLRCSLSVPKLVLVEVLDLFGCILEEDRFVRIEFPCLEKLFLERCDFVGDNLLQKILCACPKTKHISISWCTGLGPSLSVSCKPLLEGFFLRCGNEFERIKIDAPSLRTFKYESHNAACVIDLTSCRNLKNLYRGRGKFF